MKSQDFDCYGSFHLEPLTGVLTVSKNIDREIVQKFIMGLVVEDVNSDTGLQTDTGIKFNILTFSHSFNIYIITGTIEILIEDVNDNNPKFKEPYYKFSVTENSKFGVIIGTVLAEDSDENKTITYNIEGTPEIGNLIYLDSNHGDIVVANKIDREENEWLNMTVSLANMIYFI